MSRWAGWSSVASLAGALHSRPPRRPAFDRPAGSADDTGASVIEIALVLGLVLVVAAAGLEALRALKTRQAGQAAARALLHDLQEVALRARTTGRARGVRLTMGGGQALWEEFEDGNANGIRTAEIEAGIDPASGPPRPAFRNAGATLAIVKLVPTTDHAGVLAAGSLPIRFGISPLIVFTPRRTASSGSIYVAGDDTRQYAIRVLGTTQRWRLLCLDEQAFLWRRC